ncbi:MAG TPA: FadR/GntR family transcriptional regulator [Azospirillum sp.]|nr:FadR/GntR family transcriptional regulator [Azospirillum sp.]
MDRKWRPITQQVVERLQRMIADGELEPGSRLPPQRELAERFDVSRTSLREAVLQLESMGLIRIEPSRGAFVNGTAGQRPSAVEHWRFSDRYSEAEVYQLRYALEGFTVRLSARQATAKDVAHLRSLNAAMLDALISGDLPAATERDFDLHIAIIDIAGNRAMREIIQLYRPVILESQRLPLSDRDRLLEPVQEHEAVIRALERHDGDVAAVAMRHHIARAAERLKVPFAAS